MNFFQTLRARRLAVQHREGYEFAAGALLAKTETVDSLLTSADNPFDRNEFDKGIEDAVRDWENL